MTRLFELATSTDVKLIVLAVLFAWLIRLFFAVIFPPRGGGGFDGIGRY